MVAWAAIAGALKHTEVVAFADLLHQTSGIDGEVGVARRILWEGVGGMLGREPWTAEADMPLGAMVFMGSETTPLYHVAVHVGEGYVVGACSPDPGAQVNALLERGLSPFTTFLKVPDLMENQKWTFYTGEAFWKGWLLGS